MNSPNEHQSQKFAGDEKASSLYHSGHLYGPGTLIGIDFQPEMADKKAPPFMARLDLDNCSAETEFCNQLATRVTSTSVNWSTTPHLTHLLSFC